MKLSLPFDHKLTGRGMLPDGTTLDVTLNPVKQAFRRMKAQIVAGWKIEHKPDGSHADITADTLTLATQTTWTPTVGGAGGTTAQTYAIRSGYVIKIDRLVIATFHCEFTSRGTITGNLQIQGLPYTAAGLSSGVTEGYASALYFSSLATNWVEVIALVQENTTVAVVTGATAAAANNGTALTTTDLNDTSLFSGTLIYRASS